MEQPQAINGHCSIGHVDGTISIWNIGMRQCLAHKSLHNAEVRSVSYSPDGRYVASAGFDRKINITDTQDLNDIKIVKSLKHDDKVVSVRWHPYLNVLISTSADKSARVWAPQNLTY